MYSNGLRFSNHIGLRLASCSLYAVAAHHVGRSGLCFGLVRPSVRACVGHHDVCIFRSAFRLLLAFCQFSACFGSVHQIGNESVPIQLAQCRFPGLAISNAKI